MHSRDVTESAKIRLCQIQILCFKSIRFGCGFRFVTRSWPRHFVQAKGWNAA